MELPNIKEIAPSASGYPIKDYALKPHEMSSLKYHTRHQHLSHLKWWERYIKNEGR